MTLRVQRKNTNIKSKKLSKSSVFRHLGCSDQNALSRCWVLTPCFPDLCAEKPGEHGHRPVGEGPPVPSMQTGQRMSFPDGTD